MALLHRVWEKALTWSRANVDVQQYWTLFQAKEWQSGAVGGQHSIMESIEEPASADV